MIDVLCETEKSLFMGSSLHVIIRADESSLFLLSSSCEETETEAEAPEAHGVADK